MQAILSAPFGDIVIIGDKDKLESIHFSRKGQFKEDIKVSGEVKRAKTQLKEYFQGKRLIFDLNLDLQGTEFQKSVWKGMNKVKFGKTSTYGELADRIKRPNAQRAIGGACGANKFPIVLPCHRIVASQGLGGFAYGLEAKKWLLEHEKSVN